MSDLGTQLDAGTPLSSGDQLSSGGQVDAGRPGRDLVSCGKRHVPLTAWPRGSKLPLRAHGWVLSWTLTPGLDGQGRRLVVTLADPAAGAGRLTTVQELLHHILVHRADLLAPGGGVTVTGAEPFQQASFTSALLHACTERGVHTALVTSGMGAGPVSDNMLEDIGLVRLRLPSRDPAAYIRATGRPIGPVLRLLHRLAALNRPVLVEESGDPAADSVPMPPGG
jgi:pyruvate formate lyase activating enzyme